MTSDVPQFLIVGTPRSGTTLLQRLASELPGVSVTPETHFFPLLDAELGGVRRLPTSRAGLVPVIEKYCAHPLTSGLGLVAGRVLARVPDHGAHAYQVFSAVVAELGGDAPVVGEKTPDHLQWWRPLTAADPGLRIVTLVRDPRAVAASMLAVPFGMSRVGLVASQWAEDVRLVARARERLGARNLTLSFEDMVTDPAGIQRRVAAFLGLREGADSDASAPATSGQLFPEWEEAWKARALQPISRTRIDAWRTTLTAQQVDVVERVVGPALRQWGYPSASAGHPRVTLHDRGRLLHHRAGRRWRQRHIDRLSVGAAR